MIVVGLTGGIASGKSFIIKYLKKLKIPTHESDLFIESLYVKPTKDFLSFLISIGLGDAVSKKTIDKKLVRKKIFKEKKIKKKLEKYLHRKVSKDRSFFLKKNKNKKIVFLDIPLLFEKNLQSFCNYVCSALAPVKTRQKRALNRMGMTNEIFKLIVENQVSDKERRLKSDFLINTAKTKNITRLCVDKIIHNIIMLKK